MTNGSFETGTFSGWTLGGNFGVVSAGPQTAIDGNAESGLYAANIGAIGSDATLSQAIQTTAGQHYTLTFWLANASGGTNDFKVKWNGATVLSLANAPAQGYTQYTYDVVGTAGTSQLLISGRQDPSHWSLDAISVVPVGSQASTAPTITSFSPDTGVVGDGITDPAILTLTGTAVANSTVKVYDGATLLGTTTANGSGAWSFVTAALPDGLHSLTATDTVSGVTSAASAVMNVTIDTVAPVAPTIASFSTDSGTVGDHITNDGTLTLTGSAEANATVKVYDGATLLGSAVANGSGAWTYTTVALANGAHSLTATASDAAANTSVASSALSVTIDTVAPNAPVETGASIVSGTTQVQLTGTAEANSTLQVFDGTTPVGTATANSAGAWSLTTGTLASGSHSFTTKATDAAGNTGLASAALAVTIPSAPTAPAAPVIATFSTDSGVAGDHITNDNTLTLSGTAAANSTVKVFDGTTQIATATANSSGAWSSTATALLDGSHNLTATATNAFGTSSASAALAVTVDTVAPNAPVETGASIVSGTTKVQLTGTAEANSTLQVFDGTTPVGTATANSAGAWSLTTGTLTSGSHSFTTKATDAAGNTGAGICSAGGDHPGARGARYRHVLDRQRCCRGPHHQRQYPDPERHGRGQQHGEGVRRRDPDRDGDGQQQRGLEFYGDCAFGRQSQSHRDSDQCVRDQFGLRGACRDGRHRCAECAG